MITAAEAAEIAANHLARGDPRNLTVRDGREVHGDVYGLDFAETWIAIPGSWPTTVLDSTYIVAISKQTGSVVYEGPAIDEG